MAALFLLSHKTGVSNNNAAMAVGAAAATTAQRPRLDPESTTAQRPTPSRPSPPAVWLSVSACSSAPTETATWLLSSVAGPPPTAAAAGTS